MPDEAVGPVASRPGTRRRRGTRFVERYAALILTIGILILWQGLVFYFKISEFVLPTPLAIMTRLVKEYRLLASNAEVTLVEIVAGFALGIAVGLPLALAIFYWRPFERAVYPLLVALQTIPKVALAPLLVLYLGYGWGPKITLAFLISFFPIVIATVIGLQSLDATLVNLVRSMGGNEWQVFVKVRLPAALPNLFGGLKVAITLAVIGAVIGEYIASERGLGYLQLQANSQFDTTLNYAAVLSISFLGVFLYWAVDFAEHKIVFRRDSAR